MRRLTIFASGSGTNAENIISYFRNNPEIAVSLLVCNNATAPVIEKAKALQVPVQVITREEAASGNFLIETLNRFSITHIALAGYLMLLPKELIAAYRDRIINIHPALLPKFGGKGMYGKRVHEAVRNANESETGITIHLVDEEYDRGDILFQAKCEVTPEDTVDTITGKVHLLEQEYFPQVIQKFILQQG